MDETTLVAAIFGDRDAYEQLAGRLDPNDFSEQSRLLIKAAIQYYKRDSDATRVARDVIVSKIRRQLTNRKHADSIVAYLDDLPDAVSPGNIAAEYRAIKRHKKGLEIAGRLAAGDHDGRTDVLIEKYMTLGEESVKESRRMSLAELYKQVGTKNLIKLSPPILNEKVGGGMIRGDHIVIFGRPDSGKTMFAIHLASSFLSRGYKVLYISNEDERARLQVRFLSRMGGERWKDIPAHKDVGKRATKKALTKGYDNLTLLPKMNTNRISEIEQQVRRYEPDILVIDQIRNIDASDEGRVMSLDKATQAARAIGSKYKCLVISLTQAGGMAEQKLVLGMNDVDYSKTGIPGACDLMIGLGVNKKFKALKRRMLSICKCKYAPGETHFKVYLDPQHNAFLNAPRKRRGESD